MAVSGRTVFNPPLITLIRLPALPKRLFFSLPIGLITGINAIPIRKGEKEGESARITVRGEPLNLLCGKTPLIGLYFSLLRVMWA